MARALCALLAIAAGVVHARSTPVELALVVRVARCGGREVRPRAWIDAQLAAARQLFAQHGVRLTVARRDSFDPARCALAAAADRDALAVHAAGPSERGRVSVLVVEQALDLDLVGYKLMGVHWRYRGSDQALRGRRYVILTARARPPVLAHELCHYLGLGHDPAGGNLMTPGPSARIWRRPGTRPRPFAPLLTAAQARRVRAAVRALALAR